MNVEGINISPISEALIIKRDKITRSKLIEKTEQTIKRGIDIIGGICGIALLIPITIGIWIANAISKDKGPIFYNTQRIGKDGRAGLCSEAPDGRHDLQSGHR